jgi:hypothetical protein
MSLLEKRREELERGAGGDHDLPYQFTLPTSMPQVLAWVKLLARVQQGEFQLESEPSGAATGAQAHEEFRPLSLSRTMASTWYAALSLRRD